MTYDRDHDPARESDEQFPVGPSKWLRTITHGSRISRDMSPARSRDEDRLALAGFVLNARRLVDAGHHEAARKELEQHLGSMSFDGSTNDPVLIDALMLYASLEPGPRQFAAAAFAYRSTQQWSGHQLVRRIDAARLFGRVAHSLGQYRYAIAARSVLLELVRPLEHDSLAALVAQADLAGSLHRLGRCGEASRHADRAWQQWRGRCTADLPVGSRLSTGYAHILAGCQRRADLQQLLAEIRTAHPRADELLPFLRDRSFLDGAVAEHHRVCAGQLDLSGLIAVEQEDDFSC
ncbi:hypothetical protein [Actinoplanes philippinensis]|uniref:hypothetical protein n=1 Tax=Actinoplanes philippinensis TaxID=35752 RepID=UPI0033E815B5